MDGSETGTQRHWTWWIALLGGGAITLFGIWALVAPQSFFDQLAVFEPYNRHFVHDIGAFQIGLGAVLLLAALAPRLDALAVALLGVGVGLAAHVVSHLLDTDLGGSPGTDIPTFLVLAVAVIAAGVSRARAASPTSASPDDR